MYTPIDVDLKKRCVDAFNNGMSGPDVYREIFYPEHPGMTLRTFRRSLARWKKKDWPDVFTLESGTYPGFIPYNATVQVNDRGEIVQSWIRQNVDDIRWQELLDTIKENTEPKYYKLSDLNQEDRMLEIPLFDMHFPQNDHIDTLAMLMEIISRSTWDEINIIIGQDMFHNDDMRGRTSSGTPIEKVDMAKAWTLAKTFWANVIETAFGFTDTVKVIYSPGNHDESMSWAFVQMLREMYPQLIVLDSMEQRKILYWKECFIGITHGYKTRSKVQDLRGLFTIEFPEEFAKSKVREIHAGHLHREAEADLYGVMIRRLSKRGIDDQWTKDEGYVGVHKRFMVFEWAPGALRDIHFL